MGLSSLGYPVHSVKDLCLPFEYDSCLAFESLSVNQRPVLLEVKEYFYPFLLFSDSKSKAAPKSDAIWIPICVIPIAQMSEIIILNLMLSVFFYNMMDVYLPNTR